MGEEHERWERNVRDGKRTRGNGEIERWERNKIDEKGT